MPRRKGLLPPGGIQRVPRKPRKVRAEDGSLVPRSFYKPVRPKRPRVQPRAKQPVKPKALGGKPKAPKKAKPFDLTAPLDRKSYRQEMNALVGLKYAPEERELESQERISGQQQQNLSGWYDDYLKTLNASHAAQAAHSQYAQQQVTTQANTAFAQDEEASRQLQARANESAAIRGTSAGPNVEGTQAAQARRALNSSFAGLVGAQGAAQSGLSAGRIASGAGSKVLALQDESSRQRQIQKAKRELAQEKGLTRVQLRKDLREGERKYALERAAFGLDVAKEKADIRKSNKDRSQREKAARRAAAVSIGKTNATLRGQNLTRLTAEERLAFDEAKKAWEQAHPNAGKGGGKGGLAPDISDDDVRSNRNDFRIAQSQLRRVTKGKPFNPREQAQLMVSSSGSTVDDLDIALAAAYMVRYGQMPPKLAKRVRRMGIRGAKADKQKTKGKIKDVTGVTDLVRRLSG